MVRAATKSREVTPAKRGQIVQRVLVDGWSVARAAAAFGVDARQVARWVAAYRRFGMASLRGAAGGGGCALRRWRWRLRTVVRRFLPAGRVGSADAASSDRNREGRSLWK